MKTFWKTNLIIAGLAFGAAAGSGSALAGTVHKQDSGKTSSQTKTPRMPPALAIYSRNHPAQASRPHAADRHRDRDHHNDRVVRRDRDRDHDRDHHNDRVVRRDRDHDRDRDRHRDRYERGDKNIYVYRDHDRHDDWRRYSHRDYGFIAPRRHAFGGYGAQWMWWGGQYRPYNPPAAFRNCYPVVRYGFYHGRRARYGGTMCYNARGSYLLPNSTFIINLY